MKRTILIVLVMISISIISSAFAMCEYHLPNTQKALFTQDKNQKQNPPDVALLFINQYVKELNTSNGGKSAYDLVKKSNLVTKNFKNRLKKMIDDANRRDPEMGLGFDPILNGQDYPERGFELKSFNKKKNLVIVQGIDWPEFTVTLKMVNINGKWLVDGCGVVNIP